MIGISSAKHIKRSTFQQHNTANLLVVPIIYIPHETMNFHGKLPLFLSRF